MSLTGALSTCAPLPSVGEPCSRTGLCAEGAYCLATSALCAAQKPGGASCAAASECLSGLCQAGFCESPCLASGSGTSGCQGPLLSLYLGLGGALVLLRRRKRA